ncbi:MAG: J domain-containing protein [Planctomycetota bacterium]|jgi:hypothetical protein
MAKDYYSILGVGRDASKAEIQEAYRALARRCHPDVNPDDPEAGKRFAEIEDAYEMLCEPQRRRPKGAYHTALSAFLTVHSMRRPYPQPEPMADCEFAPALVIMATVIWLALVCACVLMVTASGSSADLAGGGTMAAEGGFLSARGVVGVFLGLITLLYVTVVVLVIAKWGRT